MIAALAARPAARAGAIPATDIRYVDADKGGDLWDLETSYG